MNRSAHFALPVHSRLFALMAMVAACASPVSAQGLSQPISSRLRADESLVDGARALAINLARLSAASAPRPSSPRAARPGAAWSASAQDVRDSILVSIARTAVGTRYVRGGQSVENGFDCSGLVRYIMSALDVPVPRTAAQQAGLGLALGRDTTALRAGDLLTFGRDDRGISHVGVYIGNGRYVHASSVAGRVIESEIRRPQASLVKAWQGTRRLLSFAAAEPSLNGDS
jgi:cell wall-associated NlpC family hydrolase